MKRVLIVFGTRPEAIKLAPLARAFRGASRRYETVLCATAQHRDLLDPVLSFFGLAIDIDLDVMRAGQSLTDITVRGLERLCPVMERVRPDLVLVQGDTTTTLAGALSAFYARVRLGHVEAGLRSGRKDSPFPEEANRKLVSHLADEHYAPTERARQNLAKEGIACGVHVVGNTAVDALLLGLRLIRERGDDALRKEFSFLDDSRRLLLVTGHRRESFDGGLERICRGLREIAGSFPDAELIYPVHPNPRVGPVVHRVLGGQERVHLVPAVQYPALIWLMERSHLVITDSGGMQEEAPSLGKPVLVTRDVTERTEGLDAGAARLVGTDPDRLCREVERLLCDEQAYHRMSVASNPYGDGHAAERIVEILDGSLS